MNNSKDKIIKFLKTKYKLILICLIFILIFGSLIYLRDKEFSNLNLNIDLTKNKIYSLSKENKDKLKKIDKEIYIYYPGTIEKPYIEKMAKNIEKENDKIKFSDQAPKEDFKLSSEYIYLIPKNLNLTYSIAPDIEGRYLSEDKKKYKYLLEDKIVNGLLSLNEKEKAKDIAKEKLDKDENKEILKNQENEETYLIGQTIDVGLAITSKNMPVSEYEVLVNKLGLKAEKIYATNLEEKIPEKIKLLIIPGLMEDITETMLNNLIEFGNRGGNFFIANAKTTIYGSKIKESNFENFNKFIKEYGLEVSDTFILQKQDISEILKNNKEIDPNDVESNYVIKADPKFENKMPVAGIRETNEKMPIYIASPIKILENNNENVNVNVNVNVLAKTINPAIEVKDIQKYYEEIVESKTKLLAKDIYDKTDKETINEILENVEETEENKKLKEEYENKTLEEMLKERRENLPKFEEKEFNLMVEADKKSGNTSSKMIYISSDEVFYGKTSLNHEGKMPAPLLTVPTQRFVLDTFEYLKYGDFNIKEEDSANKYIREITKEEDLKEKTRIYLISAVVTASIIIIFNIAKTLNLKNMMLKDIEENTNKTINE